MTIVNLSFPYNERATTEQQLLQQQYTSMGWAKALCEKGETVIMVKRFRQNSTLLQNNISCYFIKDRFAGNLRTWQVPLTLLKKVRSLDADIVHVHGLGFPLQTFVLRLLLKRKTAIVVQHQGGLPATGARGWLYRLLNSVADGFFFVSRQQGTAWFRSRAQQHKIMPVMEGATSFTYANRQVARAETGITGQPVFLWVGRLDGNKDPLTVLDGMHILFSNHPGARLYMVYSEALLLKEVQQKIAASPVLRKQVHLVGRVAHTAMAAYYNSADYFVLGSHHEGSGYALSEALACGCIPIVTAIPSFSTITGNGRLGALWETGDSQALARAAAAALDQPLPAASAACTRFFEEPG